MKVFQILIVLLLINVAYQFRFHTHSKKSLKYMLRKFHLRNQLKHRLRLNRNFIFRKSVTNINTDADTENWRDAAEPPVVIAEPEPEPIPEPEPEPEPEEEDCEEEIDDEWKKKLRTPGEEENKNLGDQLGIDGIPPPKIIFTIENPDQYTINPHEYDKEIDCKIKQGIMFQVDHFDVNPIANEWQVHAKAITLVLNTKQLSLFANENVNALIISEQLKSIEKTQKVFDNSVHCFDILDDEYEPEASDTVVSDECYNKPSPQALLTLCAPNEKVEKDWVRAIANFKTCDIRMIGDNGSSDAKFDILQAENNNLEQQKQVKFDAFTQQLAEQQRINSQFRVSHSNQSKDTEENETRMVQNKLEEIRSKVKMANAKEDHELNSINQDKEKLQMETEKLEEEKRCLEEMLQIKEQEEDSEKAIIMKGITITEKKIQIYQFLEEQQANEEKLLDEATECILKTKDKEQNNLVQMHQDFVTKIKNKQDSIKEEMVKETIKAELNTPADECYSDKIEFSRDQEMKQICGEIAINNSYDAVQLSHCLVPSMFCEHCCGNHFGSLHQEEQNDCNKKCEFRMENAVVFDEDEGDEQDEGDDQEEEQESDLSPEQKYFDGLQEDGEEEEQHIHYESQEFNQVMLDQKKEQLATKKLNQVNYLLEKNHLDNNQNDHENTIAYRHDRDDVFNGYDKVKHENSHRKRKVFKKK